MIEAGLKGKKSTIVTDELTADRIGSGLVKVYATPMMVALMEETCNESVSPYLNDGECTVGTRIEINHTAATPVGMRVTCESELQSVDGRQLTFIVKAYDNAGEIGNGVHERFIVKRERFEEKAESRALSQKEETVCKV